MSFKYQQGDRVAYIRRTSNFLEFGEVVEVVRGIAPCIYDVISQHHANPLVAYEENLVYPEEFPLIEALTGL